MSSSTSASLSSDLQEAAEILQQQLIYNGEVLDIALESLRSYKEGTQSLVYLDSSVHLAYSLLRMLEKWAKDKGDGTYVRRRKERRRKKKDITEEEGIPDVEEEPEKEDEDVVHETLFTFEAFESVCCARIVSR
jgi:replication fork protection complex subunit Tof1/Swi1